MWIIRNKKIFLTIGAVLVLLSIVLLGVWGFKLGIDFKGGAITEVVYETRPESALLSENLERANIGDFSLQAAGSDSYIIRTKFLSEEERADLEKVLTTDGGKIERYSSIGPAVSKELANKSLVGIVVVVILTVFFIAFTFRGVKETEEEVSSWTYGIVAIVTLFHDIIIPAGVFAALGHYLNIEIDLLFVMAMLSILGISINDTIVIFDRIRENIKINREERRREEFGETVGRSLSETFTRSFNTSVSTLLVLFSLLFLGAEATWLFILAMTIGMVAGVYSSLFIAAPLLVLINERKKKVK